MVIVEERKQYHCMSGESGAIIMHAIQYSHQVMVKLINITSHTELHKCDPIFLHKDSIHFRVLFHDQGPS